MQGYYRRSLEKATKALALLSPLFELQPPGITSSPKP